MLTIGLTGGIGSGKSSAARLFAQHGAAVVDTDAIAHQLTEAGQPALNDIRAAFADCVAADGRLDRAKLRQRVFADPAARKQLEAILHPSIRREAIKAVGAASGYPYCILVVPLLFETGNAYRNVIQRTLVVDSPETLQIERTVARSGLSEAEVRAVMAAQLPRAERLSHADDVLANAGSLEQLAAGVAQLHRRYLALAEQLAPSPKNA